MTESRYENSILHISLLTVINTLPSSKEIRALHPSVQHTVLESPLSLTVLAAKTESDDVPPVFMCPLCPGRHPAADHFEKTHWTPRINVGEFSLFPCFLRHGKIRTSHFHCPLCLSLFAAPQNIIDHLAICHPTSTDQAASSTMCNSTRDSVWYSGISERWEVYEERKFVLRAHPSPIVAATMSLRFASVVEFSGYPLAVSLAEKRGSVLGDAPPRNFKYVEISGFPFWDPEETISDLFQNAVFLILGRAVSPAVTSEIVKRGGQISGAHYLGGTEWPRFTHGLVGAEICPEKIRDLWPRLERVTLVDQIWVRGAVETGNVRADCDVREKIEKIVNLTSPSFSAVVPTHLSLLVTG